MQMTRAEIIEKLEDVFRMAMGSQYEEGKYSEDSILTTDLGLNSVGVLYCVIAIEEFFDMRFDNVGFNDFKTVRDVVNYIEAKQQ